MMPSWKPIVGALFILSTMVTVLIVTGHQSALELATVTLGGLMLAALRTWREITNPKAADDKGEK